MQSRTEENREYFELFLRLRSYASIIRNDGFLALEEELQRIYDEFLATSIKMGIDGVNTDLFREIQERHILVDSCRGKNSSAERSLLRPWLHLE